MILRRHPMWHPGVVPARPAPWLRPTPPAGSSVVPTAPGRRSTPRRRPSVPPGNRDRRGRDRREGHAGTGVRGRMELRDRHELRHRRVGDLLGVVAGDPVAGADVAERRFVGHAVLGVAEPLAQPAARVEPAAGRRVGRRRHVAREDEALLADPRIRVRHGRQQGDRVRVPRPLVELRRRRPARRACRGT